MQGKINTQLVMNVLSISKCRQLLMQLMIVSSRLDIAIDFSNLSMDPMHTCLLRIISKYSDLPSSWSLQSRKTAAEPFLARLSWSLGLSIPWLFSRS